MKRQSNNNQDKLIYKFNEKKTGNRQLDKGLAELKYNSMPLWVRLFAQGVRV